MPVKNDFSEKFNACDNKLIEIVKKLTRLEKEDIRTLLEVSHTLPYISALEDGDAYIDILTEENNLAVVVAQHRNPKWDNVYIYSPSGYSLWLPTQTHSANTIGENEWYAISVKVSNIIKWYEDICTILYK